MSFDPEYCRNEREVESKLIVQYLLPKLGYSPDTWYQEVTFEDIRVDFLVSAIPAQAIPIQLDADSPLSVVIEAKHPKENLDQHVRRLKRYLTTLRVRYGLLTNGKEIRIYEITRDEIQLVFQCSGSEIDTKIGEVIALIGKDSFSERKQFISQVSYKVSQLRKRNMKTIAVYHNKGGVGKTTTVVNLAAALSKKGYKILVIDLDSQANTTFATGLVKFDDEEFDDIKDCNILHVLQSEEFYPIEEVARKSRFSSSEIEVIPSHIDLMQYENDLNQLDYSRLILLDKLEQIKAKYDFVLIDTPPSLNLYARIALITANFLIIPSDLKPFANQGLKNVRDFIQKVDGFRKQVKIPPLKVIGVIACKISTNARFIQHTLPKRRKLIPERYGFEILDTVIYERDDLAKCAEQVQVVGELEIPDPRSVLDYKPDSTAAQEFELLAMEVLEKIGSAQ